MPVEGGRICMEREADGPSVPPLEAEAATYIHSLILEAEGSWAYELVERGLLCGGGRVAEGRCTCEGVVEETCVVEEEVVTYE